MLTDEQISILCASQPKIALRCARRSRRAARRWSPSRAESTLTFVLKLAVEVLGANAIALTAISASVSADEADEARALAQQLGARHVLVESKELDDPRYAANPTNRCYFCKTELYTLCEAERLKLGLEVVLDGFNADDKKDHRPGHQAARERAVASPLAEAGLTKDEIRAWSKRLGLSTWDKPQMACLASRLPYGTQVTVERLNQVGRAEKALRALGPEDVPRAPPRRGRAPRGLGRRAAAVPRTSLREVGRSGPQSLRLCVRGHRPRAFPFGPVERCVAQV